MKLKYFAIVYFFLSVQTLQVQSATMCEGVAYPVVAFQDKFLYRYFMRAFIDVHELGVCATLCVTTEYCASFFHNKAEGSCNLHYKVIQEPSGALDYPGSRYYILSAEGK